KTISLKELTGVEKVHELFIGKVINTYSDEKYLTNETPDIEKLKIFTYSNGKYWKVGEELAKAWVVGKSYEK
ncbi:hypothetical protein LCGC14_2184760, partial [marine sediment metagenome]